MSDNRHRPLGRRPRDVIATPTARSTYASEHALGERAAPLVRGARLEQLADDLGDIEDLLARGRLRDALDLAGDILDMTRAELLGVLGPHGGAAGLSGYLQGLLDGNDAPDPESFATPDAYRRQRRRGYGR